MNSNNQFLDKAKKIRPQTPHIIIDNVTSKDFTRDNLFKSFNNFMKQVIDSQNDQFLNGSLNIIDYILAKYLNIEISEIGKMNKISIKINGDYGLLNQFGERLPNLLLLKLNNSFIQSITDIGTSFKLLRVLQLNNCMLKDLSGLICFENLEIFEGKNNKIDDLFEIEMCTSITKLNLENNLIEKDENLDFLSSLDNLVWLNISKNPIKDYENKLMRMIPSLKVLNSNEEIVEVEKEGNEVIVNKSNSTNESSPLNSKKTVENFFKRNGIDDDDNNNNIKDNPISIVPEMKMNMTLNTFNVSKDSLKPIIIKKEEDCSIKNLRESLMVSENNNMKPLGQLSTLKKPADKHALKKDIRQLLSLNK